MRTENSFADMSYKEQQDRWLEWRSQQLEYREGGVVEEKKEAAMPSVSLPYLEHAAPARHSNLDQVLSRHRQAGRHLSAFRGVTPPGGSAQ